MAKGVPSSNTPVAAVKAKRPVDKRSRSIAIWVTPQGCERSSALRARTSVSSQRSCCWKCWARRNMPSCQTTRLVQVMACRAFPACARRAPRRSPAVWAGARRRTRSSVGFLRRYLRERALVSARKRLAENAVEIIHQRRGDAGMEPLEGVPGMGLALRRDQVQPAAFGGLAELAGVELGQERAHRRLHRGHGRQLVQANVAQGMRNRLDRAHPGLSPGADKGGQRVIVADRKFQRVVAAG